ncbi:MAG: hypothetical protein L0H84_15095 [Pseudonocardia sp.]|nr:hypothetical protein [Pseudonocardia sp.]
MVAAAVALLGAALAAALFSDLAPAPLAVTAVVLLVAGEVCAVLAIIDTWHNQ